MRHAIQWNALYRILQIPKSRIRDARPLSDAVLGRTKRWAPVYSRLIVLSR